LQVAAAPKYKTAALEIQSRNIVTPAIRGMILDSSGKPLAVNQVGLVITVDRSKIDGLKDKGESVLRKLAKTLKVDYPSLYGKTRLCGEKIAPELTGKARCWNGSRYQPIPVTLTATEDIALQIAANLAILSEPFLPFTAEKLRNQLGLNETTWAETGGADLLPVGTLIGESSLLFEKIEDDTIEKQVKKLQDSKRMNELENAKVPALKETIQYDDFAKMDIRIGTILEAEKLPKSDKLLKFLVDDGFEKRTILSGIAKHFSPEEMIGKQVTFLANLAPRKMMGIESNGMILMAENRDGSLALLQPHKEVWNGGPVS
jgi:methionine--tRNA ligase beta chain